MTKILVPFKYSTYENAQKVEKIGYYEDELSNVFNLCTQCLSVHDRHSKYCQACSDEYKAGEHEKYKDRLVKNEAAVEEYEKKAKEKDMTLTRFGRVTAILNGSQNGDKDEGKSRKSSDKVRRKGKAVVQDDVQDRPKRKARTKARVV